MKPNLKNALAEEQDSCLGYPLFKLRVDVSVWLQYQVFLTKMSILEQQPARKLDDTRFSRRAHKLYHSKAPMQHTQHKLDILEEEDSTVCTAG